MQQSYRAPDFSERRFRDAPGARFVPAPADGVLPDDFFATSNLPTYVKLDGEWRLPRLPRMDGAIVQEQDGGLRILEGRYVRAGQPVAVGYAEDGSEGIFVNFAGFMGGASEGGEFQFMSSDVSREKPVDYALMAELLRRERDNGGHVVWVVGPAVLHSRGRDVITWFIENGYVGALLGGNAVAVHDIEQALLGTTLGMDRSGRPMPGGHAFHMRAINRIARAGSIRDAVEQGVLTEGIMHACVKHDVPFVLAGSIRDDGPLPDTVTNVVQAQEMMREHACRTTMTIMIATALHSIAFGNMLPAYFVEDGTPRPITTIAVDSSEFVVSKLKDRGTHQAFGVITNAQDFLHVLRYFVEQTAPAVPDAAGDATADSTRDAAATA
jgi:lysine-ketoglutarate reductase/saccharopine dehydrogenase-like protein (TIGR00300 family)